MDDLIPLMETHMGHVTYKNSEHPFWEIQFPNWEARQAVVREACEKGYHIQWVFNTGSMVNKQLYLYPR
jgi:hypothetical protein